ncbi:hypothetical protein CV102_00800 [Natronococcus pandeyae]|uniref:Uncharacterized protein n=1 Tax=Natronococcus pandeyae TaxID=2055836 RepID=A0A8J8Q7B3_9EURY|nr:hypothetical protein [Natronococcus pandeyae]TYL40152.1 hypothetical protein CV102_00800 [Natronococcus pandeyae]
MEYAVSREGTTLVTLHNGSDTTATDDATEQLAETFESLAAEGAIDDWEITDAEVDEHPTAPFDPYTIAVTFAITVPVEADDADEAGDRGADLIDDLLEDADVDAVSYTSPATASAA